MTALAIRQPLEPDVIQDDFAAHSASLPGVGLAWLDKRRAEAMAAFASTGVPTRRVEAWKYTDLSAAIGEGLAPASRYRDPVRGTGAFADIPGYRIVFVNGFFDAVQSSESGVETIDLSVID